MTQVNKNGPPVKTINEWLPDLGKKVVESVTAHLPQPVRAALGAVDSTVEEVRKGASEFVTKHPGVGQALQLPLSAAKGGVELAKGVIGLASCDTGAPHVTVIAPPVEDRTPPPEWNPKQPLPDAKSIDVTQCVNTDTSHPQVTLVQKLFANNGPALRVLSLFQRVATLSEFSSSIDKEKQQAELKGAVNRLLQQINNCDATLQPYLRLLLAQLCMQGDQAYTNVLINNAGAGVRASLFQMGPAGHGLPVMPDVQEQQAALAQINALVRAFTLTSDGYHYGQILTSLPELSTFTDGVTPGWQKYSLANGRNITGNVINQGPLLNQLMKSGVLQVANTPNVTPGAATLADLNQQLNGQLLFVQQGRIAFVNPLDTQALYNQMIALVKPKIIVADDGTQSIPFTLAVITDPKDATKKTVYVSVQATDGTWVHFVPVTY